MHSKPLESPAEPPAPIAAASSASSTSPVNPLEQHKLVDEKKQKRKRDDVPNAPVQAGEGAASENPAVKECKVGAEGFLQPPEGRGAGRGDATEDRSHIHIYIYIVMDPVWLM